MKILANPAARQSPEVEAMVANSPAAWSRAERIANAIKAHMTPEGDPEKKLNLPPLLEKRRHQYGIPDEAFEQDAIYNWVLVHQVPPKWNENGAETYEGTSIVKTERARRKEEQESSRGVVVSAGLSALDSLRSHGIDLGHIISFVKIAPWIRPTAVFEGHEYNLIVLRDGDLISSEDLPRLRKSHGVETVYDESAKQHVLTDASGKRWTPSAPVSDESY